MVGAENCYLNPRHHNLLYENPLDNAEETGKTRPKRGFASVVIRAVLGPRARERAKTGPGGRPNPQFPAFHGRHYVLIHG